MTKKPLPYREVVFLTSWRANTRPYCLLYPQVIYSFYPLSSLSYSFCQISSHLSPLAHLLHSLFSSIQSFSPFLFVSLTFLLLLPVSPHLSPFFHSLHFLFPSTFLVLSSFPFSFFPPLSSIIFFGLFSRFSHRFSQLAHCAETIRGCRGK